MLTSRNIDLRWILATIVERGNCQFWGWHELFFVTFFWLIFFLRTWNQNFFSAFARENSPVQPLPRILVPPRDTPQHSVMNEAIHSSELSHQCQAHIRYFIALLCFWMLICTCPYNVTAALVGLALGRFLQVWLCPNWQTTAYWCGD
jgi:hypothetical protein